MKLPGPDHPITISRQSEAHPGLGGRRCRRRHHPCPDPERSELSGGAICAAERRQYGAAGPHRADHALPVQGGCELFQHHADGKTLENAIWTYETPFPAMAEIAGHLAFYPDKVKIEEVA